jgi:hypothetical protein
MVVNIDSGRLPLKYKNQDLQGLRRWHMSRNVLLSTAMLCPLSCLRNLGAQTPSFQPDVASGQNLNSIAKTIAIERPLIDVSSIAVPEFDTSGDSIMVSSTEDSLPDDPAQQNPVPTRKPQTKRILGIVPNFRAVSTDEKLPPQTVKEKFVTTTQDSFDYSAAVIPIVLAGYSMAVDANPSFGQGLSGYGQYLWRAALDQTSENYLVEFVVPVMTRQDSRYYTLGRGGFFKRTGYALSRAVITRSDSGKNVFNTSEVVGAGASAGLSSTYYPASQRSFSSTVDQWGLNVGVDAFTFVLKEFWPDINHKFFHYDDPK